MENPCEKPSVLLDPNSVLDDKNESKNGKSQENIDEIQNVNPQNIETILQSNLNEDILSELECVKSDCVNMCTKRKGNTVTDVPNEFRHERVNGLVQGPVLKSQSHEDCDHSDQTTESADSGHGSSCHDCECGSGETEVTILSEGLAAVNLDNELSETEFECRQSPLTHVDGINYVVYESELQMPDIMRLITKDLSEPYSIYTYRYFIHNWPKLCFLAKDKEKCVGAIVCKLDLHKKLVRRGYIAMLAIDSDYRRRRIGSNLVTKAIRAMISDDCDEVVLETEITNKAALKLYENLGFVRDKRLFRYYLNGVDALRLKLWLR